MMEILLILVFLIGMCAWFSKEWHNAIEIDEDGKIIEKKGDVK